MSSISDRLHKQPLPNGFELFNNVILNNKSILNEIKDETRKNINSIKNNISSMNVDNNKLFTQINAMINEFTIFVNSPTLNPDEKLSMTYAIRDIMDDINLKMHAIVNQRNRDSYHHPLPVLQIASAITEYCYTKLYNFGLFGKIEDNKPPALTEQELIKTIQAFQSSIVHHPYLEALETEMQKTIRELTTSSAFDSTLSKIIDFFSKIPENELSKEFNKLKYAEFTQIKNHMHDLHVQKRPPGEIQPYFDVKRDITSPLYNFALRSQQDIVKHMTRTWTPQAVCEGMTFQELIDFVIKETTDPLDETFYEAVVTRKIIESIGIDVIETCRKRLAANLGLVLNDKNLTRLMIHMNLELATVASSLHSISQQPVSPEALIQLLGFQYNEKQFKEMILDSIYTNMSKLCVTEHDTSSKFTVLGNAASEEVLKFILTNSIDLKFLNQLLNDLPRLTKENSLIQYFALDRQIEQIAPYRDIILLYLINTLLEKMHWIADEARQAKQQGLGIDVSGLETKEMAIDELKNSAAIAINAIELFGALNFKTEHPILNRLLAESKVMLLVGMLEFQGEGGVLDVAAPIYKEILTKWLEWLSK